MECGIARNYKYLPFHRPLFLLAPREPAVSGLVPRVGLGTGGRKTGSPQREFLNVDDAAAACVFLLDNYSDSEPINIAGGNEISIRKLNDKIAALTGYQGAVEWDTKKPDGMPRKLLDGTRLAAMGWTPKINFDAGLQQAYEDYLERVA